MTDDDDFKELERQFRAESRDRAGRYPEGTLVAYRGKKGCDSILCDHRVLTGDEQPDPDEECLGWHCAKCHEPCGLQGHADCGGITGASPSE